MKRTILLLAIIGQLNAALAARQEFLLDKGWRFAAQDAAGSETAAFDDSYWSKVSIPHGWDVAAREAGETNRLYEGPGWYRLHLNTKASQSGKSFFIKFDAAYHSAEVFVNGHPVGSHVGGFSAFCFDITPWIRPGQDNLLAVKVSFKPLNESPPLGGDFTKYPGIYRNVRLLVLDPISITPLDDAGPGVYLKQAHVDETSALIELTTKLRNGWDESKAVTVRTRLLDAAGRVIQAFNAGETVPARGNTDVVQQLQLAHPHLWNGRQDPYLYQVEVEVVNGNKVVDQLIQPLGLRYFRVDPARGFFLNGRPFSLHGVNRHQDRYGKGWAINPADMRQDLGLLLDMGCTTVRLAHYQHDQYFHELCDKSGLIVWSELDMVNTVLFDSPDFVHNTRQQLQELIKQNYNHPSIFFWSIGNEIYPPDPPPLGEAAKFERCQKFLQGLHDLAHQLDATRLTTIASCCDVYSPASVVDIFGWNGYPGWYSGEPEGWDPLLPVLFGKIDGRALGVSEYGAGASVQHHQLVNVAPQPGGRFHPEEWQSHLHEIQWHSFQKHTNLWGTYVWNMFDFSSLTRREGDHDGRNDKGLVTADRKICKDAFYFYQSHWTTNPMVYITSRRFTPHPAGKSPVKVYSNGSQVELLLNGKSLGLQSSTNQIFLWPAVDLPVGKNTLRARADNTGRTVTDEIVWDCRDTVSTHLGPVDPRPAKE